MMLVCLAALPLVLFILHSYIHWSKKGRMINKFPGPSLTPVLGNALDLVCTAEEMFAYDTKMARKYKTSYRFWTVHSPCIRIIDPDDAEVLLSSYNPKHTKKSFVYDFIRPWLNDGLVLSSGEKWHKRRKLLTPTFHFNILKQFCGIFRDECEKLVKKISTLEGEAIDIQPLMCKFALQTICETAMGTKLDAVSDSHSDDYLTSIKTISALALARFSKFWMFFDFLFNMSSMGKLQVQIINKLHKFTDEVVKNRRLSPVNTHDVLMDENAIGSKKRLAMLDLLLDAEKKGSIDAQGIREEVDTFMFEGHDTTTMGLTYLLMELANNPEIQDRVVAEISETFTDPSVPLSFELLNKMPYLDKCLKEGQRMYPSVPTFSRILQEDLKLKNRTVPSGTICTVQVYHMQRKEDLYPDPSKFDPERFTIEKCAKRHPFAYIPFSAGPRNCIGQKFAMLEMKAVVTALLRNFRLIAVTRPQDIVLQREIILRTSNKILIMFERRDRAI